ncbi:diguanylate cyclase [Shewanella submarina]|uniref:diguanylate cyclase n=1 Tax=Shewanella submarina TaxID=2016376 RepID=A0ABV7GG12_9GAMM|nr:GGDEF domain-containing protein [Shewanella submarina]MCL1037862.1 diguanylate cyclase [Shewanella submarina]
MKWIHGWIVFFVLSVEVLASTEDIERLLAELEQVMLTQPARGESIIQDIKESGVELTPAQQTRFYFQLSIQAMLDGRYDDAVAILKESLKTAQSPDEIVSIHYLLSTVAISRKDYPLSLIHIRKVLSRIDEIDDVELQVKGYNRILNVYYQFGAYKEAAEYAILAYQLNDGRDPVNQCTSMLFIGLSFFSLGELEKATSWLDQSIVFCGEHDLSLMVAMSQKGKAESLIKQGELKDALVYLKRAEQGYLETGYELEITDVNSILAETYLALKQPVEAEKYALRVIRKGDKPEYLHALKKASQVLAQLHYDAGNYKQAYQHQQEYIEYAERLMTDTSAKSLAYQMAKFDSDEKDRHIHLLEQERGVYVEQRATEHQKQSNLTLLLLVAAAGLMICLIVIILGYTQRGRYKRMAQYDSLTGVMNRSTGFTKAENTYVSVMARHSVMSAIMVDLDAFKAVNDQHGHSTGDWALRMLVDGIKAKLRRMDILVRLSGEEFAIFLPDMPATDAESVAESIRLLVMEMEPRYAEEAFKLTASLGVSVSNEGDLSLDPILARADIALHQAKESGGNQVVVYGRHNQEV